MLSRVFSQMSPIPESNLPETIDGIDVSKLVRCAESRIF
jgi:hypothetical protein